MKKVILGIIILLSLLYIGSCDGAKDESADKQKAAQALKVVNDSMTEFSVPLITDYSKSEGTIVVPDLGRLSGTVENDEKTLTIAFGNVVEGTQPGILMTVTLTGYRLDLGDGAERTVSGTMQFFVTFELPANIVVVANTPEDQPLQFTGGELDGKLVGFKNVKMSFDVSSTSSSDNGISTGSPAAVSGTLYLNGLPVYLDSEILDLMITML